MTPVARRAVLVGAVVLLAAALRLGYVLTAPFPPVSGDAAGYVASAGRLVSTGTYAYPITAYAADRPIAGEDLAIFLSTRPNAYAMPGYVLFLAPIWRAAEDPATRLTLVRIVQALLGALSVLLVWATARRILGVRAAAIALVAAAIFPPFIWATGEVLTETLFTFVLLAFLYALVVALDTTKWWQFAIAGALLGISTMIRPLAVVWIVLAVVYMVFSKRFSPLQTLVSTAALGLALVLVMTPWWVRNQQRYGVFVPLTTCGSNPLAAATSPSYLAGGRPQVDYPPDLLDDDYALGQYWSNVANAQIDYIIKNDLGGYIRIKLLNARFAIIHFWPEAPYGRLAVAPVRWFSRGMLYLLYALGLVGIVAWWRNGRLLLVASLPLYFIAAHLATLFLNRYLYPADWVWVVPAAAGAAWLWAFAEERLRPAGAARVADAT